MEPWRILLEELLVAEGKKSCDLSCKSVHDSVDHFGRKLCYIVPEASSI